MASNIYSRDYVTVGRTENFCIVHKKASNPLDETDSSYLVVFSKYNTIEAKTHSFLVAIQYMREAERLYQEVFFPSSPPKPEKKPKETLQ